tara:strand:- start:2447 stop:2929 length:483 start_codon:yes stop_codon:yes gene_type:complete
MAGPELMIASAVIGGIGAMQEGKAQAKAYRYNASINERNAKVAEQEGEQLVYQTEIDLLGFEKRFENLQAATQQSFRYNGWIADSGTALKVAMANANEADEEIATQRYNAQVGKQQKTESALEQRMQANLNNMYASSARKAGFFKAGSSLLSGAAQAKGI